MKTASRCVSVVARKAPRLKLVVVVVLLLLAAVAVAVCDVGSSDGKCRSIRGLRFWPCSEFYGIILIDSLTTSTIY